jgi:hypothetical protein
MGEGRDRCGGGERLFCGGGGEKAALRIPQKIFIGMREYSGWWMNLACR